jgi:hypothetical protein
MEATRCELAALGFGQPEPPDQRASRLTALRRFYGEHLPDSPTGAA